MLPVQFLRLPTELYITLIFLLFCRTAEFRAVLFRRTMGLLTILKKNKEKERELRLLMLGLDNAGKTTVVKKFNGEDIDLISPTLGFNIKTLEYRGFKLNIWDVGGQTSLRSYWRNYFEQTDGLIWVVDSADRARLQDCKAELQILLGQEVCVRAVHSRDYASLTMFL